MPKSKSKSIKKADAHQELINLKFSPIDDLIESLKEYQRFNTKRNNTEAYLYALGEYALGNRTEKPNAADYGITSKSIA